MRVTRCILQHYSEIQKTTELDNLGNLLDLYGAPVLTNIILHATTVKYILIYCLRVSSHQS